MPKDPQFLLLDALELFLLDRDAQNLAKKSLATYSYRLIQFVIAIANIDAEQAHRQNSPVSTLLN